MINRRQKELIDEDITSIGKIYHSWRSKDWEAKYMDVPGLCKSISLEIIKKNNYVLTPGRYIDFKEEEDDDATFDDKMKKLTEELKEQMTKVRELDDQIARNLVSIGFNI